MLRDGSGDLAQACGVAAVGLKDPKESQILPVTPSFGGAAVPSTGTRVRFPLSLAFHPTSAFPFESWGYMLTSSPAA